MSLHIVQLQAENYKRLKAVTITPEGNVVFIGGKNAQGKTSVLDAIWAALAGGEASRATQQPIRDGQDTAVVRLDLGEFIVTRRWTKDDAGTLTVESADGAKYSSPQKMLDDLIGARAFDPLAFTRMSARDQVAALVATVELPFDPSELERERKGVFDSRTEVNREVDKLKGQLAGLTKPNDDTPDVEVSSADIIAEFEKARAHNDAIVRSESLAVRFGNEVDSLTKQIAELTAQLEATAAQFRTTEADRAKLGDPIDTDGISARLAGVEQTNAAIREGQEHHRVTAALSSVKERAAQLTVKLQQIEKRKAGRSRRGRLPGRAPLVQRRLGHLQGHRVLAGIRRRAAARIRRPRHGGEPEAARAQDPRRVTARLRLAQDHRRARGGSRLPDFHRGGQ